MEEIPTVLVLLKAAPCNQIQLILIQIRFYLCTFLIKKKPKAICLYSLSQQETLAQDMIWWAQLQIEAKTQQ